MNLPINPRILLCEQRSAVLLLTLNRPTTRNALSEAMIAALMAAIQEELAAHARGEQRAQLGALRGLDEVSQALLEWLDLDTSVLRKGRAPAQSGSNSLPRQRSASLISMEKSWHTPISLSVGTLAC